MKKLISLFLAIIMVSLTANTAFAAKKPVEHKAHFNSFTGIVKEIRKSEFEKDTSYALLVNEEGMEANLVLTKDTYYINDEKIRIGSKVTGYYDANAMMIMIYPPQYVAVAVMVSNSEQNIKVDLFDTDLVSADNLLKLNISNDTEIVLKDGKEFKGGLKNRKLAVFYGASTRSIPAQTIPDKIVVLSDPIVPDEDNNSYYASFKGRVTKMTTMKNDKNLTQITIEDKEGIEAIFTISKDTYRTNDEKIKVGSVVTGYYDAKVFRIMIYPGQYEAEVLAVERSEYNIKVDYFDNKLISADNTLKITIGKNTELIYMNGRKYNGKPVNSNLLVIYNKATKSIPAQTEPIKVIVLEQKSSKDDAKDKGAIDKDKDKAYWKSKLDEWMKLTDELFDNMDQISGYKDELYRYIWKLMARRENSLFGWLNVLAKDR
ncbi:MAG: hypothetical protein GX129_11545 [Clostridiales bacterium]|jgi:hypothetical protein|nr:hypothetical protein [Clostridiales bacterium]